MYLMSDMFLQEMLSWLQNIITAKSCLQETLNLPWQL